MPEICIHYRCFGPLTAILHFAPQLLLLPFPQIVLLLLQTQM